MNDQEREAFIRGDDILAHFPGLVAGPMNGMEMGWDGSMTFWSEKPNGERVSVRYIRKDDQVKWTVTKMIDDGITEVQGYAPDEASARTAANKVVAELTSQAAESEQA